MDPMDSHSSDHSANSPPNDSSPIQHQMNSMFFHFGVNETFLFEFWNISSGIGIFFASLVIILFCFIYEFFGWYRNVRRQQQQFGRKNKISTITAGRMVGNEHKNSRRLTKEKIMDAILHGIHLALGNILMLVFMTFNVWLCVAVILGQPIARLTFGILLPQTEDAFEEN